jgi:Mrp family chromosome partitioning ATPase
VLSGGFIVDLQAKKGLQRGDDLWQSVIDLAKAVEANLKVYGVLLTNSPASGTVREQLKNGIERVGQGRMDDLPEIATDFVDRLQKAGIKDVPGCCKRLRIIVRDFEPGSSGEDETFSALRRVLADEKSIVAARNTLVSESMDLMQGRGRLDAADLARKLSHAGIEISKQATNPIVFLESFLEWSVRSNETFVIPGLGLALPIEQAWVTLRAMDSAKVLSNPKTLIKQIENYLEWHRLAETTRSTESINIERAADRERLLVVVAGPGAGKSTLTRRLARFFSQKGRVTLRVSLRTLAMRLRKGESLEESLISAVASEGFSPSTLSTILSGSSVSLLADGLDETDPDRAIMADHLRKWALQDNARHVIVTTRPVGHDPAWFDGWKHFELLPLGQEDVKAFAYCIYAMLFPADESRANQRAEAFLGEVKNSRTASIASRNPQLLGLLLTLHVRGSDLSGNRYELFDRVMELIRQQSNRDRTFLFELPASTARRALELIGWALLNNPLVSRSDVIQSVGTQLATEMHQQPLAGQQTAEQALGFWEERGLLEQLSDAGESVSLFIHLSFRDQTAANYLSKLPEGEFIEWVRTKGRLPAFRETLLLTGGTVRASVAVETLLKDDDVEDPISTGALLAADVLAEAQTPSVQLRERVISHLLPRLTSPVPLVVYETAEKLRPLALVYPSLIGPVGKKISTHESNWVARVGCALALLAGDEYVDGDALVGMYPDVTDTRLRAGHPSGFILDNKPILKDLLIKGAEYLLQADAPPNHIEVVTKKLAKADFSSGVYNQIWQKLRDKKLSKTPEHTLLRAAAKFDWGSALETTRDVSKVILAATVAACDDLIKRNVTGKVQAKSSIGRLHQALAMGSNPIHELPKLLPGHPWLTEVVRGTIAAVGLDPNQLKSEIQQALSELEESPYKLIDLEPDEELAPSIDWKCAEGVDLDHKLLFAAVNSGVACLCINATELLLHAVERDTVTQGFRNVLNTGSGDALQITAEVATTLWEAEALNLIIERLRERLTSDCAPLIDELPALSRDHGSLGKVTPVLSYAVQHGSVPVVEAALAAIEKLGLHAEVEPEIRTAYNYCLNQGPRGPEKDGIVPPNAVGPLLKYLTAHGMLGFEDLREALVVSKQRRRSEVKPIVVPAIAKSVGADETMAESVLREISAGTLPADILYSLSKNHPSFCSSHETELFGLLDTDDPDVKIACIRLLGHSILDRNRSQQALRHQIKSDDHSIRDEAVRALRRLRDSPSE